MVVQGDEDALAESAEAAASFPARRRRLLRATTPLTGERRAPTVPPDVAWGASTSPSVIPSRDAPLSAFPVHLVTPPEVQSPPEAQSRKETGSPEAVIARAAAVGLRRIDMIAWRDLDDPEAGGSELHAHRVASLWSEAGLEVRLTTSAVAREAAVVQRDGYVAERRFGRYAIFPRTVLRNLTGRTERDGLVEVWNGMPFLSPLWARCPRMVFLHHVHGEMWEMTLPSPLAKVGDLLERRVAPWLYRSSAVVTLSASSRAEIVSQLGLPAQRVSVLPPGVDPRYGPGGARDRDPLVVAVGRLVPVKRFGALVDALVQVRARHPRLRAVIVGEGYERGAIEATIAGHDAGGWIELAGRVGDDQLVSLYRRAWVLASMSRREGWGMTITEAAACGTPAVVSRIAGHSDAVVDGVTGFLAGDTGELVARLDDVLSDDVLRRRLGCQAVAHAGRLTWEATAFGALEVLVAQAEARMARR